MRIVSLVPSATETLFALGLGEQITGVTQFCIFPEEEVKSKTKVGGTKNPNLKLIFDLRPDVVIVDLEENRKEDSDHLRANNIDLLVTFCRSIQDAARTIMEFGSRFNVQEQAAQICGNIKALMNAVHPPYRRRTLTLIWRNPYMTVNADTYVDSVASCFGFDNVFANRTERYPSVTGEEIRAMNPEVVLFPDEPYPFQEKHLVEFQNYFPELTAVRENHLIRLDGTYFTWHGYRTLLALQALPEVLKSHGLWS